MSGSTLRVVRPGRTRPRPRDLHLAVITVDGREVEWLAPGNAHEFVVEPGVHEIGVRLRFSLERAGAHIDFVEGGTVTLICDTTDSPDPAATTEPPITLVRHPG